jgi:hypothetical protein
LWAVVQPDQSAINDVARAYYRYTHRHTIYKPGHPMHIGEYAQTAKALSAPLLDLDYSQFCGGTTTKATATASRHIQKKL